VREQKLEIGKFLLRAALIFFLVYFAPAFGFFPVSAAVRSGKHPAPPLEAENGMGGMSLENSLPALSEGAEPVLDGIPEPEEYSKPRMLLYTSYTTRPNDTISQVAKDFGLDMGTLLSVNNIQHPRLMQINQTLRIPNQDGIQYKVKQGDTLASIAEKYQVDVKAIQTVNELFSPRVGVNTSLFIPGGRLAPAELLEITGDLFLWPVRGHITSSYGYRLSPFTGTRQFHSGIDISAPMGTAVRAGMAGRVTVAGYNGTFGNYVVITHHSGYRSLYGHLSVIRVKAGAYVSTGERIGDVGSTGLSTGPHLHFTVYKNGVTVNPRGLVN
jgi:LysM repeat protein